MKLPIKKIWLVVMAIAIFLIIGNPGKYQLKEYLGYEKSENNSIRKKYNFLLFSIYTEGGGFKRYYLGVCFNFFYLGERYER